MVVKLVCSNCHTVADKGYCKECGAPPACKVWWDVKDEGESDTTNI